MGLAIALQAQGEGQQALAAFREAHQRSATLDAASRRYVAEQIQALSKP